MATSGRSDPRPSTRVFLLSGIYALLCIPGILLAERNGWSQRPFHSTQWLAVAVCLVSSAKFLWGSRGLSVGWRRPVACLGLLLSGLYLLFIIYVMVTLTFLDAF